MAPAQLHARELEGGSDFEAMLPPTLHPVGYWGWKKLMGAVASATVLLAAAAALINLAVAGRHPAGMEGAQDAVVLDQPTMEFTPPRQACSKTSDNCMSTGCCAVSGLTCFKQQSGQGKCMKMCDGCEQVAPHVRPVVEWPGMSFFCFSVYTSDTGTTRKSTELELLKEQKRRGVSIFRCAESAVYSDVEVPIALGMSTIKVEDVKNDFHFAKRKSTGAWVNTGMFIQVWKKIGEAQYWARHNYVVKVDPDAVFFPNKLYEKLRGRGVTAEGVYFENCKYVDYGYFGNLEVFSKIAFGTLLGNLDTCYTEVPWKIGIKNGKYGPMGEDLFAQVCMDSKGVTKVEAWDLTTDGACEADRPEAQKKNKKYQPTCAGTSTPTIHPFKDPKEYFACMEAAEQSYSAI